MEILWIVTAFIVGALTVSIVGLGLVYHYGDSLIHRIRYKRIVLPCPACRDEETDEPTGKITPKNPYLQDISGGQTFDCSTCDGQKYIAYEFPRGTDVEINDRKMLEGSAPGQPEPTRRFFG